VQSTDIVLVFTTRAGVEGITGGKVTLGADASVALAATGNCYDASVYTGGIKLSMMGTGSVYVSVITAEDKAAALQQIEAVTDRAKLSECDFVVEAATERFEIKKEIFRDLDRLVRPEVILASNTSSISITRLGALTRRPEKVIGMHFFNPVPVMKLVEAIRGLATSQETFTTVRELAVKLGKTPVEVNDAPGFVSNRVLMPLLNEAMYAVMEGVATAEAVDEVFKLGMAHPMGPLTLADFIGLDVCLDIMRVMQDGLGDPKYRPCPLLIKMVDAGWLGRKSGQGFYKY